MQHTMLHRKPVNICHLEEIVIGIVAESCVCLAEM